MKRTLLASGMVAAMLFVASSAFAQSGINLRWTNCAAVGGLDNRTFACLSNLGVNTLAGTFILPSDLPRVSGNAIIVDLISQTSPLPPWWQFVNTGACRDLSLSIAAYDGDG